MVQPANKRLVTEATADTIAAAKINDTASATRGALNATYVTQNQTLMDLRKQPGVVGDGVADDAAAIQAALSSAASLGLRVFARGTFKIASTVNITGSADLTDATFNYTGGAGVAVRVGVTSGFISRQTVRLPHVINTNKTVPGWGMVAGSIGVEINNLFSSNIYVPRIQSFETGLKINGLGTGVSYVNFHMGHLDNNKVNMQFTANSTGWANQNSIFGGRMSHNSNEGTVVTGTRHVLMDATTFKVNNNNFFNTSLESPNVVEYHLDCAGVDNFWWGCRWENTGTGPRVIWRTTTQGNAIKGGYESQAIVETTEGQTYNEITSRAGSRFSGTGLNGAVMNLQNSFSATGSAIRIFEPTIVLPDTTGTSWSWNCSAQKLLGKRSGDAFERVNLDSVNGRIYFGNGTAATARYLGNYSTFMGFDGSDVGFPTDNTYDFGRASQRPRYVRAGTAVVTGAVATGSRPAAATAGKGAMIFDDTLGTPIYSDGTTWRKFSDNTAA